jgi:hypothetical protein
MAKNPRYRGLKPFKKGQSGNPAGRPKGSRNKVASRTALETLVRLMRSKRSPAEVQLKSAKTILDIAMGVALFDDD